MLKNWRFKFNFFHVKAFELSLNLKSNLTKKTTEKFQWFYFEN